MKRFFLFLTFGVILLCETSFAASTKVATYCDCYRFRSANLPVFARSSVGSQLHEYKTNDFQNCVDIRVQEDAQGALSSVQIGNGTYHLNDLSPGPLYFGVRKKIAHSMELVDFDPRRGGKLRFYYLKSFSMKQAMDDDFSVRTELKGRFPFFKQDPKTPEEIREVLTGPNWEAAEIDLQKSTSGEWTVIDSEHNAVNEILAVMTGKSALGMGIVGGISEMIVSTISTGSAFEKLGCQKSLKH